MILTHSESMHYLTYWFVSRQSSYQFSNTTTTTNTNSTITYTIVPNRPTFKMHKKYQTDLHSINMTLQLNSSILMSECRAMTQHHLEVTILPHFVRPIFSLRGWMNPVNIFQKIRINRYNSAVTIRRSTY